jgi:hypothetical protein
MGGAFIRPDFISRLGNKLISDKIGFYITLYTLSRLNLELLNTYQKFIDRNMPISCHKVIRSNLNIEELTNLIPVMSID